MSRTVTIAFLAGVFGILPITALADWTTGVAGGSQPFSNLQPSLAMNAFVQTEGIYPSVRGAGDEQFLGCVRLFAGNFGPGGDPLANGQLLSIAQNTALFSLLGTTYGGNGLTTFALPDLWGRTAIGARQGPGLSPRVLGETTGAESVTVTDSQMPAHSHTLPPSSNLTSVAGGSQPMAVMQPSLALNPIIALQGVFPSPDGGTGGLTFLGQVSTFAGSFAPGGWAFADGQLLPINQNQALFSLLGTTYGGNGITTFALPDLRGRTAIGARQGAGLSDRVLGETTGAETVTLTTSEMPIHSHTLPPSSDLTGDSGGSQPFPKMQPSLTLDYIIATQGIFPSRDGGAGGETYLGEVTRFAGNFAPRGWAFADGQLLPISQNTALFALLGTMYGGDGKTTFALPDLRGRTVVGPGQGPGLTSWDVGQTGGAETVTLTQLQMPAHDHTYVPEPSAFVLVAMAVASLLAHAWWRKRAA